MVMQRISLWLLIALMVSLAAFAPSCATGNGPKQEPYVQRERLEQELREANAAINRLRREAAELRRQLEDRNPDLARLTDQLNTARRRIAELERQVEAQQRVIDSLRNDEPAEGDGGSARRSDQPEDRNESDAQVGGRPFQVWIYKKTAPEEIRRWARRRGASDAWNIIQFDMERPGEQKQMREAREIDFARLDRAIEDWAPNRNTNMLITPDLETPYAGDLMFRHPSDPLYRKADDLLESVIRHVRERRPNALVGPWALPKIHPKKTPDFISDTDWLTIQKRPESEHRQLVEYASTPDFLETCNVFVLSLYDPHSDARELKTPEWDEELQRVRLALEIEACKRVNPDAPIIACIGPHVHRGKTARIPLEEWISDQVRIAVENEDVDGVVVWDYAWWHLNINLDSLPPWLNETPEHERMDAITSMLLEYFEAMFETIEQAGLAIRTP